MINNVTRLVRGRDTASPKTTLGFYGASIAATLAAAVGTSATLAYSGVQTQLIPYILIGGAIISVLILLGVFVLNFAKPQNLMLGQITGREYAAIEKVTLGDSQRGERVVPHEVVLEPESTSVAKARPRPIAASTTSNAIPQGKPSMEEQ